MPWYGLVYYMRAITTTQRASVLRLFGLKPIKLRRVINICLTTEVWFIASINIKDNTG